MIRLLLWHSKSCSLLDVTISTVYEMFIFAFFRGNSTFFNLFVFCFFFRISLSLMSLIAKRWQYRQEFDQIMRNQSVINQSVRQLLRPIGIFEFFYPLF
jgi:hypothetical protein